MTFRSIKLLLSLPQISSFQSVLQPSKDGFWKRGEALGVGSMSPSCRQPLAALGHQEVAAAQSRTELSSALDAPMQEQPGPDAAAGHSLGTVWAQL